MLFFSSASSVFEACRACCRSSSNEIDMERVDRYSIRMMANNVAGESEDAWYE